MFLNSTSGFVDITTFSMTVDSLSSYEISWGDGTYDDSAPYSHIYSSPGSYLVTLRGCDYKTDVLSSETVCVSNFINNALQISIDPSSSVVGCGSTFQVCISSTTPTTTLHFYSSGSLSDPYSDKTFFSHLKPQWKFQNSEGDVMSMATISCDPISSGNTVVGYSACYGFDYIDDMPASPIIFITMETPYTNSRVYAAVPHNVTYVVPDRLCITEDGINPINEIQWAGVPIPFLISVCGPSECNNMLHYTSGYLISANLTSNCIFLNEELPTYSIELTDENCFSTGGYILSSVTIPTSAFSGLTTTVVQDDCNYTGVYETITTRKVAMNAQIYATARIYDGVTVHTLTGLSEEFTIFPFEDFNGFRRFGESENLSEQLKYYAVSDRMKNYASLWDYTSALLGNDINSLGTPAFYSIDQFVKNHNDVDRCDISSLKDLSKKLDVQFDDYDLQLPNDLKRIMEIASIPFEKSIGSRCSCNSNFVNCEACCGSNVCKRCGFDKRSNIGEPLSLTDYVTAGTPILYKEQGSDVFEIFHPLPQDSLDVIQISTLTGGIIEELGLNTLCFFEWDASFQNNPIEAEIDYASPYTILSPTVSTVEEWYGDNGTLEEMFNYILTRGLEL